MTRAPVTSLILAFALSTPLFAAGNDGEAKAWHDVSLPEILLLDVHGNTHHLQDNAGRKVRVLVWISTECPIANAYVPTLNHYQELIDTEGHGVELYGVLTDPGVGNEEALAHVRDYKITYPVLFDASGELAERLKPTHTPEAFVFDRNGKLTYRGRIDDTWAALGKRRHEPTRQDVVEVTSALLKGERPEPRRTEPVGCFFEVPPKDPLAEDVEVTYTRDIAPILQANCVTCHREGAVGPFTLTSYDDAAKRARQIARVVDERLMPPWKPEPGFGHFLGERRLTQKQIDLIHAWAQNDRAKGMAEDLPPPPKFDGGWALGKPDSVLKMPESYEVRADGPDIYRHFVLPVDLPEDKFVSAVEFRPGNPQVVHHCLVFLDDSGKAQKLDAQDPGPGYSKFGGLGFRASGSMGGWAPGVTTRRLPLNLGRPLPKKVDLVMQVHYHPSGKVETDQSSIAIYFEDNPSDQIHELWVLDHGLNIPPGEEAHYNEKWTTLNHNVLMVGLMPHMHLLGKSMKATAHLPSGEVVPLINVPDWDFNWQDQYYFEEPVRLPKGTRIKLEAVYDNSSENPYNPHSPPKRVGWGEETTDEMFLCIFLLAHDRHRQTSASEDAAETLAADK